MRAYAQESVIVLLFTTGDPLAQVANGVFEKAALHRPKVDDRTAKTSIPVAEGVDGFELIVDEG